MSTVDLSLLFLCGFLALLIGRTLWLRDQLGFPRDWSIEEQQLGCIAAFAFAAAAVASALVAGYVASIVPWVENFPALLPNPSHAVAGREPAHVSTATYLFNMPVGLGIAAAMLVEPKGNKRLSFRGRRDLVLRLLPLPAIGIGTYSIWRSLDALSAIY